MRLVVLGVGWVVAIGALAGCTPVPAALSVDAATADFEQAHYCPAHRMSVEPREQTVAGPPPAISADEERLALWRRAHRTHGHDEVDVAGCGERAHYKCWRTGHWVYGRRGLTRHWEELFATCLEEPTSDILTGTRGGAATSLRTQHGF